MGRTCGSVRRERVASSIGQAARLTGVDDHVVDVGRAGRPGRATESGGADCPRQADVREGSAPPGLVLGVDAQRAAPFHWPGVRPGLPVAARDRAICPPPPASKPQGFLKGLWSAAPLAVLTPWG